MFRWGWERYVAFLNLFVLPVVFLKKFKCYLLDMFFCWIPLWVYSYPYKSVDGVFSQVLCANRVLSAIGPNILGRISVKKSAILYALFGISEKEEDLMRFSQFWFRYAFPPRFSGICGWLLHDFQQLCLKIFVPFTPAGFERSRMLGRVESTLLLSG